MCRGDSRDGTTPLLNVGEFPEADYNKFRGLCLVPVFVCTGHPRTNYSRGPREGVDDTTRNKGTHSNETDILVSPSVDGPQRDEKGVRTL